MNTIVREKGINDMRRGWTKENEWNKKVYQLWRNRLRNVYDEKLHEEEPTYIDSTLCLEWHWLSKFIEDIELIDGYDKEKFLNGELELDKDIKSNGVNKEYSKENCLFVSRLENNRQNNKTRKYDKGVNHCRARKVAQYDLNGNLIKIWDYTKQASDELHICRTSIINCCRGKLKTSAGFIWKYID